MIRTAIAAALLLAPAMLSGQSRLVGDLPRRDGKPLEALPGVETEYGSVRTSEGVRLRTIITRPAGTTKKVPAIFHTQAVSCGSLEPLPADRLSVLGGLAQRSGMALIRVERSGTGDSEGPGCDKLDYDTEVRHYREALDKMARHPWVDGNRIVIYGSSLGSTTAPLVAEGRKMTAVVVQGGGALTYLERMINFDRFYLERSGKYRPEQIHDEMIRRIAFHQLYLTAKKTPEQIAAERPDLADVWSSIRGGAEAPPHYGRPFAWHWQAAAKNFPAAWAKIDAPVLVAHAEYEQFEPRSSHQAIVDAVNARRPGTARLIELKGVDHSVWRYPNAVAAYRDEGGQRAPEVLLEPVLAWLKERVKP